MGIFFPSDMTRDMDIGIEVKTIDTIYNAINDEQSRKIFANRLMGSITDDSSFVVRIVRMTEPMKDLNKILHNPVYVYGGGIRGKKIIDVFPHANFLGFIDREKKGTYKGIPYYKLNQVSIDDNVYVLVSMKEGYEDVEKSLENKGIKKEKIILLESYLKQVKEPIYFEKRCLCGIDKINGLFLDIGSFDGKDAINAVSHFDNVEVIAFEPDKESFDICKKNTENYNQISICEKGISNKEGTIFFAEAGVGSHVSDDGECQIEVTTIDKALKREKVGFIKMDIEGEEENALEGGINIIKRDKPILAISVYHKRSDIWRIPQKILEINPDYVLSFGHYTTSWGDTVVYAIDRSLLVSG